MHFCGCLCKRCVLREPGKGGSFREKEIRLFINAAGTVIPDPVHARSHHHDDRNNFFQKGNFTFNGYMHFLQDQYFLNILLTTMQVSTVTTILCILIGFPVAYYVSRQSPRTKGIMLALAIFPLLTSSVVRSFSWIIILGKNGLLNSSLMSLGLIQQPLEILYTPTAVMIGLIHLFLPLIIISLVGVMENIDPDLVKAAESLGASRFTVFRKVIFPLSIPGLILGSILVFVGSMTAYTTPSVLGAKSGSSPPFYIKMRLL